MENLETEIAEKIFYMTEDSVYPMVENFENDQMVDKSLVYCFLKAFYIYCAKLYMEKRKIKLNIEDLYSAYKEALKAYYKTNNPSIEDELLDQVLNFFDNSFGLIATLEIKDIEDSYEFRHYTIHLFELLRMILEKKSKAVIRENIFDHDIRIIIHQVEEIFDLMDKGGK